MVELFILIGRDLIFLFICVDVFDISFMLDWCWDCFSIMIKKIDSIW